MTIIEWFRIHEIAFLWIGALSIVTFVGTLIVLPVLVVRIPEDYFKRKRQNADRQQRRYSPLRLLGLVLKNFFGIMFVLAGIALLFLPGQGLITILIGVMLLNFPGKFALGLRIVQQPAVFRAINWMRARANRPSLQIPKPGLKAGMNSTSKY